MPKVTFVEPSGVKHEIDAETGHSLMEVAVANDVPGIEADCGGSCACATCHIFVDEAWRATVGEMDEIEDSMLDIAENRAENSRLSCQIPISDELDGLIVNIAEE